MLQLSAMDYFQQDRKQTWYSCDMLNNELDDLPEATFRNTQTYYYIEQQFKKILNTVDLIDNFIYAWCNKIEDATETDIHGEYGEDCSTFKTKEDYNLWKKNMDEFDIAKFLFNTNPYNEDKEKLYKTLFEFCHLKNDKAKNWLKF